MANDIMNMKKAIKNKADEFYTQLTDIEKELKYYEKHFEDKIVYCNCDDPVESNFFKYFQMNFYRLGLKKLICTHYEYDKKSYKLEIIRQNDKIGKVSFIPSEIKTQLKENGDFRSEECINLLKEADIVVTNPPFSLWREYVQQLADYKKQFLIIGNINNICYKNIFPLIQENKMWLGASIHSGDREFRVPDSYPLEASGTRIDEQGNKYIRVKGVRWFTNLDYPQRHEELVLYKKYNPIDYPKYDNYNAINVDTTLEIPIDYYDYMGVPITFLDKYSPDQFEICGITCNKSFNNPLHTKIYKKALQHTKGKTSLGNKVNDGATLVYDTIPKGTYYTEESVNGYLKITYARILIRRRK